MLFISVTVMSQTDTTTLINDKTNKDHSPLKASLYSTAFPGLGQIYNKKYWKLPIIYGGFTGLYFLAKSQNEQYNEVKKLYEQAEIPAPMPSYEGGKTKEELKFYRDRYRRDRDFTIILMGLLYIIQIVDASVDAHFFQFDVSRDLSLQIQPKLYTPINHYPAYSLSCTLKF